MLVSCVLSCENHYDSHYAYRTRSLRVPMRTAGEYLSYAAGGTVSAAGALAGLAGLAVASAARFVKKTWLPQ